MSTQLFHSSSDIWTYIRQKVGIIYIFVISSLCQHGYHNPMKITEGCTLRVILKNSLVIIDNCSNQTLPS